MSFFPDISTGSGIPIFRQVIDQIRLAVATGRLSAGEQLPSVRGMAERLLVNPNTVAKAYAELTREKTIETRPGRGVFVLPARQMYTRAERARRINPLLQGLIREGISLGYTPDELIDLLRRQLAEMSLPTGES
jgi:GntR family transcriptional regulator